MNMVEFKNVSKRFGSTVVLEDVNFSIKQGEVVVLIGPSGSGKSTLLRCINALETIDSGDLLVDGLSVRGGASTVREIRQEAGMVFQQFNLFPQMTALENVAFGPRQVRGVAKAEALRQAEELLGKVGLAERKHHYPNELSGGQQQRVAIARALVNDPVIILADEATGNLDTRTSYEIMALFQALNRQGKTIVFVTHESDIAAFSNRTLRLKDGLLHSDTRNDSPLDAAQALAELPLPDTEESV